MELKQADKFLFKTLYFSVAGVIIFQALDISRLTSILFTLTFPLTVLLWLRSVRKKISMLDILTLITSVASIVFVLLNAMVQNADLNLSYMRKAIMFVMALLFLQTSYRMRVERSMITFVNGVVDFLTLFLIAIYFVRNEQMHMFHDRVSMYLTFGFENPNATGMFLSCLYMLELYRLFSPERWYIKILHIVMAVFMALFVLETQARNSLLIIVLFTIVCALLIFRGRKNMRMKPFWSVVLACFPALFAWGYLAVVEMDWFAKVFAFLTGEGKTLNARVKIWSEAWTKLKESPLIGAYHQISNGTGMSQMHNTHVDIASSYGWLVLVAVCVLLGNYFYQKGRVYKDKESYIYILGFACAVMLGIGEAALFSGGLGIYVFVATFLLLSNATEAEQPKTV